MATRDGRRHGTSARDAWWARQHGPADKDLHRWLHKPDRTEFGVSRRRTEAHVRCGAADPACTCVLEAGTRRQLRGAHGWDRTGGDRRSSSDLSLDGTTSWWSWLRAVELGTRRCRRAAVLDGHFLKWPQGVGSVAAVVRQPDPQKHAPPADTHLRPQLGSAGHREPKMRCWLMPDESVYRTKASSAKRGSAI